MGKTVESTFIGFLFSLKNISFTLLLNFVVGGYFYALICDFESFYIPNGWIVAISVFMGIVWTGFHILSYATWKAKVLDEKINNKNSEKTYKV